MPYMKKTRRTADGRFIERKLYYAWRAAPSSPKIREIRARREQLTTEQQKKINRQKAQENLMLLIANNYKANDLYLTFTYAGAEPPAAQVKKDMDNLFQSLRKAYKRAGEQLKYIAIAENLTGGGRCHAHVLINAVAAVGIERLKSLWPHGRVKAELFGGSIDDCARLAAYFKKEKVEKYAGRIRTSQNLKRPAEKKECVTRSECYDTEHIRAPRGYHIHKDLTRLDEKTADGYPCAYIIFVRDDAT